MAVTHPTPIRNLIVDTVVDQLDAGGPPGKLVMLTAANNVVATLTFANPAFGAAASNAASANPIVSDINATGHANPITKAELRQGGGTVIVQCSVGTSAADIIMNSVIISNGSTVAISGMSYTAPP